MIVSKNIYLADDDIDDHEIFSFALGEICEDCKLTVSRSGDDLLKKLREDTDENPDVIFLDINMPRKTGIEVLKEIKSDSTIKEVTVIMYSTSSNPDYIKQAKEFGASYYFIKPSDFTTLKQALLKALSINLKNYNALVNTSEFMIAY